MKNEDLTEEQLILKRIAAKIPLMGYVGRGRFATDRVLIRYSRLFIYYGNRIYTPACMVWAGGYFQYCNRIGKGRKGYFAADGVSGD